MTTDDFFRSRLDQMIDLKHPLAVLATRLPWAAIEAAVRPKLVHQAKSVEADRKLSSFFGRRQHGTRSRFVALPPGGRALSHCPACRSGQKHRSGERRT
jgi:hypothetical protein